jgi:heavy metal efflux system protein
LLPMALSHGIGSETQKPLAVVIIGGLLSATLLTLFVLPVVYLLFAGEEEPVKHKAEVMEPVTES